MGDYTTLDVNRIKHMEMTQAVVARLGSNSFVVKGWAITVTTALVGIAVSKTIPELAAASVIPIAGFFALDVYFLQAERLFRVLFDQVRLGDPLVEPFYMSATHPDFRKRMQALGKDETWYETSWRWTVLGLYVGLAGAAVVAIIIASVR